MNVAVEAKNVVKDFGTVVALDGLNFHINEGEIFGLIGLNGAGKTTMLRITSTLLLPTSGTVTVFGHDVVDEASEVRNLITYLPEEAGAYKNLSGFEYLRFMASFTTNDKAEMEKLVDAAAEISGLGDRLKDIVMARNGGAKAILVLTGYGKGEQDFLAASKVQPDFVAANLAEAVDWLLSDVSERTLGEKK